MKKIFVTGAPGWLGTRCVQSIAQHETPYQKEDYLLRCLVLDGCDVSALNAEGVELVRGDVRDTSSLRGAMDGCDYLIHMVGVVHPRRVKDFYETRC